MPEAATIYVPEDQVDAIQAAAEKQDQITVDALDIDTPENQIVDAVNNLADNLEPFGKLPAVDLPATTKPKAVAILISGDGGWRDLDKTMG